MLAVREKSLPETQRKPYISLASPGSHTDVFKKEEVRTVYADGVANMMLGTAVTKLELFTTVAIQDGPPPLGPKEIREVDLVVAMPTVALLETCIKIVTALAGNTERLNTFTATQAAALGKLLEGVKISEVK